MLERQRQYYLSTLGVDSYVPRRMLSGAASSVLLTVDALALPVDDTLPLQQASALPADAVESALEITERGSGGDHAGTNKSEAVGNEHVSREYNEPLAVGEGASPLEVFETKAPVLESKAETSSISSPSREEVKDVVDTTVDTAIDNKPAVNFVLNIWRITQDCLVLDSRQPGSALPTDKLLQNILRAIGYPLAQLPQSELIRWPLFKNTVLKYDYDNDVDQARAMVQAYIAAQEAKSPIKYLLLMGEAATVYALDGGVNFSDLNGTLLTDSPWSAAVAVTPSLIAMLQEPLQKASAWQALQKIAYQSQ